MPKIVIRDVSSAEAGTFPAGVAGEKAVCYPVFHTERDPIHLHRYTVATGGRLEWSDAGMGQTIYVSAGEIEMAGTRLPAGSVALVEHGAMASLTVADASELLVFQSADWGLAAGLRAGGHIHLLPAADVPRSSDFFGDGRTGGAVFADADCPTCEMWLHETILHRADFMTPVHSHNEDEVIVVTGGEIVLGNRRAGPGTAMSVARDTLYGFRSGAGGLRFINFRSKSPIYIPRDKSIPAKDERALYRAHMPALILRTLPGRAA